MQFCKTVSPLRYVLSVIAVIIQLDPCSKMTDCTFNSDRNEDEDLWKNKLFVLICLFFLTKVFEVLVMHPFIRTCIHQISNPDWRFILLEKPLGVPPPPSVFFSSHVSVIVLYIRREGACWKLMPCCSGKLCVFSDGVCQRFSTAPITL